MIKFNLQHYKKLLPCFTQIRHYIPSALFCAIILLVTFSKTVHAEGSLLMITDATCPFCKAWEKEIGTIYPKTDVAKTFPLVRISINTPLETFSKNSKAAIGTPTFIFIENSEEIGRISGFSNAETFWWLIEDIILLSSKSSE